MNEQTERLLSGNEAIAHGAYDAGLQVAAAYPGTPSTEILENIALFKEIDAQWSVNEKVAYEVAYGASMAGVRSLYASKHVGLNVAMDPFMTSVYMGVNAGFVAVVCDDPGLHSSQNEQDTRWVALYGKAPIIEPSGSAEAYSFIQEAFRISEQFDTPVLFRMTTRTAHSKENVRIGKRTIPVKKALTKDIGKYVMIPGSAYKRHIVLEKRLIELRKFSEKTTLNRIEKGKNKARGFITSGVTYQYIKESFPDAPILKLGFSYPLCEKKVNAFAKSVKEVVLIEEGDPFIEIQLKVTGLRFKTRHPSYHIGELRPEYMARIVKGLPKNDVPIPVRKPALCPGCPHHFVFHTLQKFPEVFVSGDIGCYTLGALAPYGALHSCICMGGGFTVAEGVRRAKPGVPVVGIVGDSTFIHSGITGLINAVYNRIKGVFFILDNSITAMTGSQENPGSGYTLQNEPTIKLDLAKLCLACGAETVDIINPYQHHELEELIRRRLSEEKLTVIIAQYPCKLIPARR
ncbi:MAG: hypothetical protein A2293_05350 [Elusimicrobia bacterium RIFOXYB2_FULL_49_7]|nr:MAG: hypothetical protein A2293_05350 [Elusimicrobia bacterium RIFOXYB2_FULL_49_7]